MSENYEIVKGFQTEQGQALYDYDSLHGKPDIDALISASEERMREYTDNEIDEFKIPIDDSLSIKGQAADAKAVGDALKAIEDSKVQIDPQLTEEGQAADAKATGLKIQEASNNTKQYIDEQLEQIQLEGVPYYGSEEEDATIGDFVYATHLGGALAVEFAKKTDVSNLGASIEERLNSDFISQSNIEETIDSKGYAKIEEVDSKIENLTTPASHATDKSNPHGVTAAQVGAAPEGFGLGATCAERASADNILGSGFVGCPGLPAIISLDGLYDRKYQVAFTTGGPRDDKIITVRQLELNGQWGEWDYLNPPMIEGEEYRTTERWYGKPVYTRLRNIGTTEAAGPMHFSAPNIGELIRITPNLGGAVCTEWDVSGTGASTNNTFHFFPERVSSGVDIYVVCGSNRVGKTLYVQAWYTKTT